MKKDDDDLYKPWGGRDAYRRLEAPTIATFFSIPVFLGSWGYCTFHYGFLLGFGLGWLPSLILAGIAWIIVFSWQNR